MGGWRVGSISLELQSFSPPQAEKVMPNADKSGRGREGVKTTYFCSRPLWMDSDHVITVSRRRKRQGEYNRQLNILEDVADMYQQLQCWIWSDPNDNRTLLGLAWIQCAAVHEYTAAHLIQDKDNTTYWRPRTMCIDSVNVEFDMLRTTTICYWG